MPWLINYKPLNLPKYSGKMHPRQFLMSFAVVVALAGANDIVLIKFYVITAEDDALA